MATAGLIRARALGTRLVVCILGGPNSAMRMSMTSPWSNLVPRVLSRRLGRRLRGDGYWCMFSTKCSWKRILPLRLSEWKSLSHKESIQFNDKILYLLTRDKDYSTTVKRRKKGRLMKHCYFLGIKSTIST